MPKWQSDDYNFHHPVQREFHDAEVVHVARDLGHRGVLIISFQAYV